MTSVHVRWTVLGTGTPSAIPSTELEQCGVVDRPPGFNEFATRWAPGIVPVAFFVVHHACTYYFASNWEPYTLLVSGLSNTFTGITNESGIPTTQGPRGGVFLIVPRNSLEKYCGP